MTDLGLKILFEDEQLLVVDKPAGLLSVRGRGPDKQDSVQSRAEAQYPQALVVHRLDCATSGLMLMAKTKAAQAALSQQFRDRQVEKEYCAITYGPCPETAGQIEFPLTVDWPQRPRQKICYATGKPAQTLFQRIHREAELNRVLLFPITGRSHQLRVHTMAMGMAIVGDQLYASPVVAAMSPRLLLHASKLHCTHPLSGRPLRYQSEVPF